MNADRYVQDPNKTRTIVAIKSVNLSKLNKKLKDNLSLEIDILRRLHHPHIVGLIDKKESTSHIHLVMEFCALGDLSYFIKKRDTLADHDMVRDMIRKYPNPKAGGLNEVVARHFLKQLASALQFLRAKNLIHRDVKPQNLLLNPSPHYFARERPSVMPYTASDDSLIPVAGIESLPLLKLADFGFARSLPSTSLAETLCGSPLYMAPEILRYEKYDAKADLWSVGTVMYEMVTGRPPFRASNHVELLRRIEKSEDRIKFAEDAIISSNMKALIRGLLKRNPVERMPFQDFFGHVVVIEEIPGLVGEDKPAPRPQVDLQVLNRRKSSLSNPPMTQETIDQMEREAALAEAAQAQDRRSSIASRTPPIPSRQPSAASNRPNPTRRSTGQDLPSPAQEDELTTPNTSKRPAYMAHATAPNRHELHSRASPGPSTINMERQASRNTPSPAPSLLREQVREQNRLREAVKQEEKEKERAAQDIAFERDYVLVEKRAVEVNAFADELAASPRLSTGHGQPMSPTSGAMVRRATTQGAPTSTTGAQTTPSRAVQIASGRRPDSLHHRENSYERRYGPSPTSATSAISKALNMASGRLFGMGISPPVNLMRGGRSPPSNYNPFPAYPISNTSLVLAGDNNKPATDEDTRTSQIIEECATRSDVVYGFAEVKYKQLVPLAPSAPSDPTQALSVESSSDEGLTVEATVTISEEALVLYVKALGLLAKSMDIAGAWWARKNRGGIVGDGMTSRSLPTSNSANVGARMNNVVQWVRQRFNEVLGKAEFVRLKLIESQKRLPTDHPSHPNNHSEHAASAGGMGISVDHVVVSSGVTAEKLMYDRALEMSRTAAINELTGEDLPSCEIAYVTAIRMLEAVLENEEEAAFKKGNEVPDDSPIAGLEDEERQTVTKRK